jgi:DNA polymerase III subunit beta
LTITTETSTAVMAATVVRSSLTEALKFVSSTITRRPQTPILNGVVINASAGEISLTTFDYEIAATQVISGTGHGKVIVGALQLLDLVKDGGKSDVIDLYCSGDKLTIASDEVTYTLATFNADDFPALPPMGYALVGSIPERSVKRLPDVLHASATSTEVPVLQSVFFEGHNGTLHAYASDRYRLAMLDTGGECTDRAVLIPRKVVGHVAKFTGDVRITRPTDDAPFITFHDAAGRYLTTREVEGSFPRVRSLVPAERDMPAELRADNAGMAKAVKQVAKVVSLNGPIRLHLENRGPSLTAGDDMAAARRDVPGDVLMPLEENGPVGFNPKYLAELLSALGPGTAVARFSSRLKPSLWHNPERREFQVLLMPVRNVG